MFNKNSFLHLVAPPAWGKTRLFHQWVKDEPRSFLYISPLRALANEVIAGLELHPGLITLQHGRDSAGWKKWATPQEHARIIVTTPEQLGNFHWEGLAERVPDAVVVWDEIHLVQMWGLEFREAMLEQWWGFCASGLCGVGLTATADVSFENFLCESLLGHDYALIKGDAGNFGFKNEPVRWVSGPQDWIEILLEKVFIELQGNTLIFCSKRCEVDQWVERLTRRGLQVLGCKGGETTHFQDKLKHLSGPLIIVSTSCLSHGVNLPQLKRVVLLYDEKNPALFHQMVTRGGRKGEEFEVWCPWGWRQRSFNRVPAMVTLLHRVLVAQLWAFMGEWWHGSGRYCHPNYSAERTRPSR